MILAQDLHRIKRLKINCFSFLVSTLYYIIRGKGKISYDFVGGKSSEKVVADYEESILETPKA